MADSITHFITAKRFVEKHSNLSSEFCRGLYFGSQGPDIFFFGESEGSFAFGDKVHDGDPAFLFDKAAEKHLQADDLYKGYAFGVMLHYFGDRIIHQYIGFLCRKYPKTYAHGEYEKDIDMCVYEREFGEKIKKFKYDKYFVLDKALYDTVFQYWTERVSDDILTYDFVQGCLNRLCKMTKIMIKPNFFILTALKSMEKKKHIEGMLTCHLKMNKSEKYMNDEKESWSSPISQYNLSVEEMLGKAVNDFEREYDKLTAKKFSPSEYKFEHSEPFSCGK